MRPDVSRLLGNRWLTFVVPALVACTCSMWVASCRHRDEPGITLTLWTLALRPQFVSYMEERIVAFERDHPGIRVEWVDVPYDAIDRKLIASAAAGRAPDVVNLADKTFARFVSLGAMMPLDGLLPGDPSDIYVPGALAGGRIGGRLLALPWYLTTQTSLVNEELLARGGLTLDSLGGDWASLLRQAAAFHDRTGAFLFSQPLGYDSQLLWMMMADGVVPFEEREGRVASAVASPEVESYLRAWVELYRSGSLPREAALQDHAHVIQLYQSGRLAMINSSPNFLGRIRDAAPSIFERTRVQPAVRGGLGRTHIAVMWLGVTTQSKHPDLAAKLAWFLTSPENQLDFCRLVNILPSTGATLDDPLFDPPAGERDDTPEEKIALARALSARALPTAIAFTPALDAWPDLRRAFEDRFKPVLTDGVDLGESLRAIDRDWQGILDAAAPASFDAVPTPDPIDALRAGAA